MSDQVFFTKLAKNIIDETVDFLIHNQTEIILKIKDKHLKTKILSKKNSKIFSIYRFSFETYIDEPVICSFEIKDEKYFFKSTINSTNSELLLNIPDEIFHLQRRNDFRVAIPIGTTYECYLKRINDHFVNIKCEIRDISLGGCLVTVPFSSERISLDDSIDLSLKMLQFESNQIQTIAKHIRTIENTKTIHVGLKFIDVIEAHILADLQVLLIHLDRVQRGKSYD